MPRLLRISTAPRLPSPLHPPRMTLSNAPSSPSDTLSAAAQGAHASATRVHEFTPSARNLLAALHAPAPLSVIVLVDPAIVHQSCYQHSPLPGAVKRRALWPSLSVAPPSSLLRLRTDENLHAALQRGRARSLRVTPFFRAWHSAALASDVAHVLAPGPGVSDGVRLKTSGAQVRDRRPPSVSAQVDPAARRGRARRGRRPTRSFLRCVVISSLSKMSRIH